MNTDVTALILASISSFFGIIALFVALGIAVIPSPPPMIGEAPEPKRSPWPAVWIAVSLLVMAAVLFGAGVG